jgi:transcriptional regulator with GAF, ATPase, and Fis domain
MTASHIFIALPLAAAVADLIACVVVLLGANDRRVGHSFVVVAGCTFLWNTHLAVESIPGVVESYPTFLQAMSLGLVLLPGAIVYNATVWCERRVGIWVRANAVVAVLLGALQSFGWVMNGFVTVRWGTMGRPGPLYPAFALFLIAAIIMGVTVCCRTLSAAVDARVRLRVKYWLVAAAAAFLLGLTNFAANYGLPIPPLGSLGNIALVCILTYAAVRHRVMDIDVFIVRSAATVLAGVVLVLPIAGTVIWAHHLPAGVSGSLVTGCLLLAALVSLFVFSRFRSYLELEVESSFFPMRHAARDAIRSLAADLVKLPPNADLYARFAASLTQGLGVSGVAVYRSTDERRIFALTHAAGSIAAPQRSHSIGDTHTAAADETCTPLGTTEPPGWEVQIPIRTNESELGFIALGPKQSGACIDEADLTLLAMASAQLAIAMQNAEYVQQIETQKAEIEQLRRRLEAENVALRAEVRSVSQFREIIGASPALQRALALVERVAPTTASIVVTGETGTGKELIARAIHDLSPRRNGPLISVNCPAIPAGLAESELFGHERGAFTDAVGARPGKFELADGGTIFLDEVADLTPDIQVKLLRVLQEHETQRVGSTKVRKLDLRVVAATNRDLEAKMRAGHFREDLYYRLAAVVVDVPPLRERTDDIPMLASYFLDRAATMYQKRITGFSPEALNRLGRYSWPGNIRELQNVVERAVLLCGSDTVTPEHLADLAVTQRAPHSFGLSIREEKLRRVERALAQTGGNQAAAARLLGMSANNLARLMKTLGLKSPRAMH